MTLRPADSSPESCGIGDAGRLGGVQQPTEVADVDRRLRPCRPDGQVGAAAVDIGKPRDPRLSCSRLKPGTLRPILLKVITPSSSKGRDLHQPGILRALAAVQFRGHGVQRSPVPDDVAEGDQSLPDVGPTPLVAVTLTFFAP